VSSARSESAPETTHQRLARDLAAVLIEGADEIDRWVGAND
jgi:hypothetical protein